MSKRLDMMTPRPGAGGKTFWHRVGTAWEADGGKISLVFDSLPLPTMNDKGQLETRVLLMEPRDNAGAAPARGQQQQRGRFDDDDGDAPF
jgi:hypothetical protein